MSFLGTTGDESVPGATVCARQLHTGRYPGLQTGCSCEPVIYFHLAILARSLKENPMTIAARGARGKEKGEKMVGRVNACTKARLCIGIKDVSPHSFVSFFSLSFSLSFLFFPFILTLPLLLVHTGNTLHGASRILSRVDGRSKNRRARCCEAIRRQYLMRSYDGHRRDETAERILFGR